MYKCEHWGQPQQTFLPPKAQISPLYSPNNSEKARPPLVGHSFFDSEKMTATAVAAEAQTKGKFFAYLPFEIYFCGFLSKLPFCPDSFNIQSTDLTFWLGLFKNAPLFFLLQMNIINIK